MHTDEKYRDIDMRIILLEHIAAAYSNIDHFVALEARYAANERRADVLVVADYNHAYEIKSDVDRLERLPEQLKDYRQTFDYLTVVTTPIHAVEVKRMLGENDGLMIISNREVQEIKQPKCNKRITKKNMIFMCSKPALANALSVPCDSLSLDEMRERAEKLLSLSTLRQFTLQELQRRFKNKYSTFLEEACIPYREGDLALLQHNDKLFTNLLVA